MRVGRPTLEDAAALCEQLEERVAAQQEGLQARLRDEYAALVAGLRRGGAGPAGDPDEGAIAPELEVRPRRALLSFSLSHSLSLQAQPVPGALRRAGPFLRLLGRLAAYLLLQLGEPATRVEQPASFLRRVARDLALPDTRALAFVAARLKSLLRALQVAWGREVAALRTVERGSSLGPLSLLLTCSLSRSLPSSCRCWRCTGPRRPLR